MNKLKIWILAKEQFVDYEIILLDNGSLRPESIIAFRRFREKIEQAWKMRISNVSLLHSSKVDPELIEGKSADTLQRFIKKKISEGQKKFLILPFFIGPSRALSEYLPSVIGKLQQSNHELKCTIAYSLCGNNPMKPDPRLAQILTQGVCKELNHIEGKTLSIAVVDHGSPAPEVTEVRNAVTSQLQQTLFDKGIKNLQNVTAFSMERRPDPEYDFNEPILDKIASTKLADSDVLLIAMLFLLPGRHAGPGGDVATILDEAFGNNSENNEDSISLPKIHFTALLHESSDLLVDILTDRIATCLQNPWVEL